MRSLLALLICCLPFLLQAQIRDSIQYWPAGGQRHIGKYNASGLKIGEHKYFFASGEKQAVVTYDLNGEPLKARTWKKDGSLRRSVNYGKATEAWAGRDSMLVKRPREFFSDFQDGDDLFLRYTQRSNTGNTPKKGDEVKIRYRGYLDSGRLVESSGEDLFILRSFKMDRNLGAQGMEKAISMMRPGDKVIVRLSPKLGYGGKATNKIPPFSTLIYEIELVEIN